jgi:hypothetical protein
MNIRIITALLIVLAAVGCNREPLPGDAKVGSDVQVTTTDQATAAGADAAPPGASRRTEPDAAIENSGVADPSAGKPSAATGLTDAAPEAAEAPPVREMTVPSGTVLALTLETPVASDRNKVEDPVRARTRTAITIDGVEVLPAGSTVLGNVNEALRSAKVKGRARIGVRFHSIRARGATYEITTSSYAQEARGTKKKDAAKIGIPAAGGAVIGAIAGGKKGAAIGGAVGGGAGTAAVLSTRGEEVELPAGGRISVRLTAPLTVRVPAG